MMSRKNLRRLVKYLLMTVIFFILCGLQTSFWPFMFGFLPAPPLWFIFIVFISLKWPSVSTLFYIYFLGYCMTYFSNLPLKMVWFSLLALYKLIWTFKSRIHSSSLILFSILCAGGYFSYSIIYIILSYTLEDRPTQILFLQRLLETGLVFIMSSPVYYLLHKIDQRFTDHEIWTNAQQNKALGQYE